MSLINDKKGIFGDIAALNTLLDRMPKLNKNSSLESASNDKNPMKFLADVFSCFSRTKCLKKYSCRCNNIPTTKTRGGYKGGAKGNIKGKLRMRCKPINTNFL